MRASPFRAGAWALSALLLAGCSKSSEVPPAGAPAEAMPAASTAAPGTPALERPAEPAPPPPAPAQAQAAPKSTALDDFTTLEDAEKALAQAKSELDRLAVLAPRAGHDEAERKPADKKAARSAPAPAAGAGLGAPSGEAAASSCDNACRAFSSLLRAASAVCRIDGESGAHCTRAKQVRADAERRVASCACPPA